MIHDPTSDSPKRCATRSTHRSRSAAGPRTWPRISTPRTSTGESPTRRQSEPRDGQSVRPVVLVFGERAAAPHAADANDSERQQIAIGMQNDVRSADRVKLIFWDGTGLCLFAKRLEGGKFRWPRIEDQAAGAALVSWS